jgi:hypothetical protein
MQFWINWKVRHEHLTSCRCPKFHRWLPALSAASCNADWGEGREQSCNKTCDKADDDNPGDVHEPH